MIPYKGSRVRKGQPSRGAVRRDPIGRSTQRQMEQNMELADSIQGYALLQELKNVALVDISEYTRPGEHLDV